MRIWRLAVSRPTQPSFIFGKCFYAPSVPLDSRIISLVERDGFIEAQTEHHTWRVRMTLGVAWAWRTA